MSKPHYYEGLGDGRYRSTPATAGPWSQRSQHGGPPAALLTRALEHCAPRADMLLSRLCFEILGAVPVDELTVQTRVLRPGRSVQLLEASAYAGGREVMSARGWQIRRTDLAGSPLDPPPELPAQRDSELAEAPGYLGSIEWRPVSGRFGVAGPAAVWTRMDAEVVAGEPPSPLQRVVAVADSGNGVSGVLDMSAYYFINPELSVHLHREPVGDWVLLDASTAISTGGTGLATSELSDATGTIGRGAQSLFVAAR